ncbi:FMN-binding protein [uncultured Ruminococcus sp.]|uniref:FMN-binding protein n=1 Tax=uncultured Ruminococcus sp. TaxID=165186 RepID=UPI0025D0C0A8|nr:FMN-binding protein [uncultured Ruminococcus sp.]
MHTFWIKTCNLLVLAALIFGYNAVLHSRSQEETITKLQNELTQQETEDSAASDAEAASPYADGTYNGEAQGYGGTVSVAVTIQEGTITDVAIISAKQEDAAYFDAAKGVIDEILEAQTTEVDTVSGATFSSNGILHAVADALGKAEQANA